MAQPEKRISAAQIADALRALSQEAHRAAVEGGHYRGGTTITDQLMGAAEYVGAAFRYVKRSKNLREISELRGKPRGFPILLANVMIMVSDIAAHAGVDLGHAVAVKMQWNAKDAARRSGAVLRG